MDGDGGRGDGGKGDGGVIVFCSGWGWGALEAGLGGRKGGIGAGAPQEQGGWWGRVVVWLSQKGGVLVVAFKGGGGDGRPEEMRRRPALVDSFVKQFLLRESTIGRTPNPNPNPFCS